MFRCDECGTVVPAGVRETKVVVETRPREYEARGGGRENFRPRGRGPMGRRARRQRVFDKGGTGWEIVREVSVCPKCAETLKAAQQEQQALQEQQAADTAVTSSDSNLVASTASSDE